MKAEDGLPKSIFWGLIAISMAVLTADFLLVYIPLSGWVLQAVLVGVYLEYLGLKRTIVVIAILEVFFMASYGGATALSFILSLVGARFILPVIVGLYFLVMAVALVLGAVTHYLFHKIRLFERISQRRAKHTVQKVTVQIYSLK